MAPWAYTSSPPVVWLSIRRAKLSYCTMPIHQSAHPNSWIIRIGIFTVVSTISFSRTAYMQITDLERSAASMNRISFAGARGTIACSILPVLVSQSGQHWKAIRRGSRAGSRGATLLIYLLNYSCSRRLFPGNHSDYFIVNINMSFKQAGPQNCAA